MVDYGFIEEKVWCTGAGAYRDYLVDEGTAWSQGIQTKNNEFNNKAYRVLVAKLEGVLATNCPELPDTMSVMEWFWRTIEDGYGDATSLWADEKNSQSRRLRMLWILPVMFLRQRPIGQVGGSPLREILKWICEHSGPWKILQESFGASDV